MLKYLLVILLIFPVISFAKNEGRFQLLRINEYPNSVLMIDSTTGKIWKQSCYSTLGANGDCAIRAWSPMNVVGVNVSEKEMWQMAEKHEKAKPKD